MKTLKTLTVTFHARPYNKTTFESCFKVDVSKETARILTSNPYELNATDQSLYSSFYYNLKCLAVNVATLQSEQTFIYTEIVDIR